MTSRIWEEVPASAIAVDDILPWNGDAGLRVQVDHRRTRTLGDGTEGVDLHVKGSNVAWERGHDLRTGRTFRATDTVTRMKPAHAARVGANFRTV